MLRTLLRDESNHFRVVEDPSAISEIVLHKDRLLWLDLQNPTAQEFNLIKEEFCLHPLAIEDAMARHQRPKIDTYDNFYLVIFYSVSIQASGSERNGQAQNLTSPRSTAIGHNAGEMLGPGTAGETDRPAIPTVEQEGGSQSGDSRGERIILRELTLFMGQNFLITVHDHPISELDEAAKRWTRNIEAIAEEAARPRHLPGTRRLTHNEQANLTAQGEPGVDGLHPTHRILETQPIPIVDGNHPPTLKPAVDMGDTVDEGQAHHSQDIGILLYSLLDTIVDNYFPVLDSIVDRIEELEERIFERYSQEAIEAIFTLKKDLLALRKVLAPERDVLNILTRRDIPVFDNHTLVYFQDVYDHVVRVTDSIDTYRDLLSSALDSFLSMQSNRLNITVQTLTALSIMLMSVASVTGWYGMNFESMPELRSAWGYPGVLLVVAFILVVEFIFFRRKGWL